MDNIVDKDLYKKAKKKADETYARPSAYMPQETKMSWVKLFNR